MKHRTLFLVLASIAILFVFYSVWSMAAAKRQRIAEYELGLQYFRGGGAVKVDHTKAFWHLRRAAEMGLPEAQVEMALRYWAGGLFDWPQPADYEQAERWAKRAIDGGIQRDAERGNARAQYALGELYTSGLSIGKDYVKGREWLERAAKSGNADAQRALGFIYLAGNGIPKDVPKARDYFEQAAAANLTNAQIFLGLIYGGGYDGAFEDKPRAAEYLKQAVEQGNPAAEVELGERYEKGAGVPQSFTAAAEHYQRAADRGFWAGQLQLALLYEKGKGVPRDTQKAAELFRKVADQKRPGGKEGLKRLQAPVPPSQPVDEIAADR